MEKRKCEIHGKTLEPIEVGIVYGKPIIDEPLFQARKGLFPHGKRKVLGGCLRGAMGNRTEIEVCDECTEAEAIWREENNWQQLSFRDVKITDFFGKKDSD